MAAAIALSLAPVAAQAGTQGAPAEQPTTDAPADAPADAAAEAPAEAAADAPADAASEPTYGEIEPVEIEPPPEPEPIEPEPEPEPEPEVEPEPEPEPEPEVEPEPEPEPVGPTPEQIAQAKTMRRAGIGLMAAGGVVSLTGLSLTIAFTALGDKAQGAETPVLEDIEKHDSSAKVGGILLASGIAVVAIGGIVFTNAKKKTKSKEEAHVRVTPALGGLVLSGKF
ncbi:hypothetical protein [Pseudenhygromyxa sp. WMMC2535]|uniref:hypothetical protein n=1 Tax=Pseudenhygromyxa sp. WMMC2535 TaxID=2712867 RepID=UPI001C3D9860|nr:hypothetical protein [Pseudenhygromyxa sp. WMMC2535]